jgi:nicotinamide-nucleotide amidase
MVAEIISVGTEILLGNIVNTNAAYLAEKCALLGISCYYQQVVGDNQARLAETVSLALSRADIILISGGLGPTEDDLSKETAAGLMNRKLVMHEPSKKAIQDYFDRKYEKKDVQIPENNWKQALIPEGAEVLENPNGTAPGMIITDNGKHIVLMPGPPNEMVPMFEDLVVPYLQKLEKAVIFSKTVKECGIGESKAEEMIKDIIDRQTNPTIATYAKTGEVHLRVTAKAEDEKEAKKLLKPVIKEIKERFGNHIYTTDEKVTLEKAVIDLLDGNKLTVCTAESCTGGMVASRLINVPGASEVFKSGYITYSNKAKHRILGVRKGTLDKYGAVSEQTAGEMAKGAMAASKADVTVAVTGLAGPDGGTAEQPVGLVYIACDVKGKVRVIKCSFSGNRQKIRESSTAAALGLLRECVLEYYSEVTFGMEQ